MACRSLRSSRDTQTERQSIRSWSETSSFEEHQFEAKVSSGKVPCRKDQSCNDCSHNASISNISSLKDSSCMI